MYLLLDECCGKGLVAVAEGVGHTAQRTREVAALGRGADDAAIFAYARAVGAVFVTINRADFVELAARGRDHPGVIILPSVLGRELARLFRTVLPVAGAIMMRSPSTSSKSPRRAVSQAFSFLQGLRNERRSFTARKSGYIPVLPLARA